MMRRVISILWPLRTPLQAMKTAGRWIGNSQSDKDWIFIVGAPRSGTTLIKTLLVAHSQLAGTDYESTGIFRLRNLETYRPSDLSEEQMLTIRGAAKKIVPYFDRVAAEVLAKRNATNFVDKLTVRTWRLRFVAKHYPRARFVSIVRDGRDCLCSARRHPNVLQSETVKGFASYWKYCVETPAKVLQHNRLVNVSYESLTASPEETLQGLMAQLGYEYEAAQTDPSVYSTTSTMKKREVHKNLAKNINTSSHLRWKRELSEQDQQAFAAVAGAALQSHDYLME